jgi:hypothetical protein
MRALYVVVSHHARTVSYQMTQSKTPSSSIFNTIVVVHVYPQPHGYKNIHDHGGGADIVIAMGAGTKADAPGQLALPFPLPQKNKSYLEYMHNGSPLARQDTIRMLPCGNSVYV